MRAPDLDTLPLTNSYPRLDPARLVGDRRALWDRLPRAYQTFLQRSNGGFLADPQLCFRTQVPFHKDGRLERDSQVDVIAEFFGLPTAAHAQPDAPGDLLDLRDTHDAEEFLPRDILAIGICPSSSLLCLSTRAADHGAVYFWDYYWRYPWSKPFFEPRLRAAERRFPDLAAIRADPTHPQRRAAQDALNDATLVKLGDDFRDWLRTCWLERPEPSAEDHATA